MESRLYTRKGSFLHMDTATNPLSKPLSMNITFLCHMVEKNRRETGGVYVGKGEWDTIECLLHFLALCLTVCVRPKHGEFLHPPTVK